MENQQRGMGCRVGGVRRVDRRGGQNHESYEVLDIHGGRKPRGHMSHGGRGIRGEPHHALKVRER